MPSTGLNPVAVRHNITPERTLFCYVAGDSDSLYVAEYYRDQRLLPPENIIALPCVTDRIITYDQYQSQIETPIRNAIVGKDIWAIVLGYRVPNIVNYGGEFLSLCSLVQRMGKSFELKRNNHTFNRVNYRFFDELDHTELYVTGVIDGPTRQDAINLIYRSMLVDKQPRINGGIFLDPYGNKNTSAQLEYQQEIVDLITYDADSFGCTYSSTVDTDDPYKDPTVLFLQDDSFYWGWYQDKTSPQIFKDSRSLRVFSYNADDTGAQNIRLTPIEEGNWCNWSISSTNPGYAATAGAVSAPGEDAYLVPRAFFKSLHFGAGLGEAFLAANRYTSWKMMLIGDPLMVVAFPLPYNEYYWNKSNNEIIYSTVIAIEDYLNRIDRLTAILNDAIQYILDAKDFNLIDELTAVAEWKDGIGNYDASKQYVGGLVASLVQYVNGTLSTDLNSWLTGNGVKVSSRTASLVNSFAAQPVDDSNIYEDGFWQIEFAYTHTQLTLENVNFIIEVATDSGFNNIVKTVLSGERTSEWKYEKEVNEFYSMPNLGFPSNYSGRRIRFASGSSNYLTHTELYYYRVLVDDSTAEIIVNATEKIT